MIKHGCSGKRSYATFQQAATGAQRARNKERLVHPYHCKHCNPVPHRRIHRPASKACAQATEKGTDDGGL